MVRTEHLRDTRAAARFGIGVTAASIALPPFFSAATPASVASGCTDATIPFADTAPFGGKSAPNTVADTENVAAMTTLIHGQLRRSGKSHQLRRSDKK